MRWVPVFILLGVLPLIGGEPTKVALSVLEKLKSDTNQPGIPEEIAVSGFLGPKTRILLNEAWNQRVSWIRNEQIEFIEGFEKIDGDLSAVLVGARSKDNPNEVEMMAFAARREDNTWKLGPVEGSFDSMGLGFDQSLHARVRDLERWMAVTRVSAANRLKEQALRRFNERLAKLVDADLLKTAGPRKVVEHFLAAARAGETEKLLVWQGILEREDHDEIPWDHISQITRRGMKNQDARQVWRLLNSSGVMQVVLDGEEDEREKSILVSFLSSFGTGRDKKSLRPVIFTIRKTPAGWRISLPGYFAKADEDEWEHWRAHQREVHFRDEVNTERMASVFEEEHSPLRAKTPEEILDEVAGDLFEGTMEETLLYLYRDPPEEKKEEEPLEKEEAEVEEDDEDEKPADPDEILIQEDEVDPEVEKVSRYREVAVWWGAVTGNRKGIQIGNKKVYRSGDLALGVLEVLPESDTWKAQYHSIWMAKDENGWMILPGLKSPMEGLLPPEMSEARDKLVTSLDEAKKDLEDDYLKSIFGRMSVFKKGGGVVPEEAALAAAEEWRKLIVGGNVLNILQGSAVRKIPEDPLMMMNNLTFLARGAAVAEIPDRVLGTQAEGRLRGVSLMVDASRGISMDCPLLVVVPTKNGPRVLVDTELFLGTNGGKELRNRTELERLEKNMAKEDFESLKKLFQWHEKTARPEWEEWNKTLNIQQDN